MIREQTLLPAMGAAEGKMMLRNGYLICNDPLGDADLILNGDPKEYLKNVTESHGLED